MEKNTKDKLRNFLGINPSMATMLVIVITLGLGEKLGERFLPVYILALGGSVYAVGILNAIDNFLTAIYAYLGGFFSDKLGYKKALYLYTVIAMVGYGIIILFPVWQAVLIGAIFFISWTALSLPAIMSLISASLEKKKQTMGVSLHSLTRRIPMALGPLIGGILISTFGIRAGSRLAFGAALILAFLSLFFIRRYIIEKKEERPAPVSLISAYRSMNRPLKTLLLSDIFIRFAEQIPYAFVVVYVLENNNLPAASFGLLTVIEMITAMLIYIPVAWLSERTGSKLSITISFIFFTIFPLVLLFSRSWPLLIVAFIIRGLKEFGEPTRKALIIKLAPLGSQGSIFGAYYLYRDVIVSLVVLVSPFLWNLGPAWNFIAASFLGLVGTLIFIVFGKDEKGINENE